MLWLIFGGDLDPRGETLPQLITGLASRRGLWVKKALLIRDLDISGVDKLRLTQSPLPLLRDGGVEAYVYRVLPLS